MPDDPRHFTRIQGPGLNEQKESTTQLLNHGMRSADESGGEQVLSTLLMNRSKESSQSLHALKNKISCKVY
jgi:hypothetical protein